MGYSALSFWPRITTSLGWASAARGAGAAAGGAGAAGSTGGAADTSGSTGAAGGGAAGVASTTAATTSASATGMGWAMGMVSSRTWATGTGGAAGAGSTPLKSDLHCSQNSAPSSLSKLQNGHFSMIGLTSGLIVISNQWPVASDDRGLRIEKGG